LLRWPQWLRPPQPPPSSAGTVRSGSEGSVLS
jgi:hypothetical protein